MPNLQFIFRRQVQHKCLICGNLIIQQPQSMKGHMTMHALTLDEYFVKYILGQGQEENEQVHYRL